MDDTVAQKVDLFTVASITYVHLRSDLTFSLLIFFIMHNALIVIYFTDQVNIQSVHLFTIIEINCFSLSLLCRLLFINVAQEAHIFGVLGPVKRCALS